MQELQRLQKQDLRMGSRFTYDTFIFVAAGAGAEVQELHLQKPMNVPAQRPEDIHASFSNSATPLSKRLLEVRQGPGFSVELSSPRKPCQRKYKRSLSCARLLGTQGCFHFRETNGNIMQISDVVEGVFCLPLRIKDGVIDVIFKAIQEASRQNPF